MERAYDVIAAECSERGVIRPRDLNGSGVSRAWLQRGRAFLWIRQLAPGLYTECGGEASPLALAMIRVPQATACLYSSLALHGLLAPPSKVWLAVPHGTRGTRRSDPPVEIVRMREPHVTIDRVLFREGEVQIPAFGVAKTVVDCFRFKRRVGEELGPAMLERALSKGLCRHREVLQLAKLCHAWEAITAAMWRLGV